jgi:dsDNA-specific endonuclease/ATPase MutS2
MNETILVAIIAAAGIIAAGLPAALIERARRENSDDHAKVSATLESIEDHLTEIEDSVDDVAEALRQHTDDHD